MVLAIALLVATDGLLCRSTKPSRRHLLQSFAVASTSQLLPAIARAAEVTVVRVTDVRVSEWPPVEYMEPMVELKQLLDGLVDGVKDEANWPSIRKRLDRFFPEAQVASSPIASFIKVSQHNTCSRSNMKILGRAWTPTSSRGRMTSSARWRRCNSCEQN